MIHHLQCLSDESQSLYRLCSEAFWKSAYLLRSCTKDGGGSSCHLQHERRYLSVLSVQTEHPSPRPLAVTTGGCLSNLVNLVWCRQSGLVLLQYAALSNKGCSPGSLDCGSEGNRAWANLELSCSRESSSPSQGRRRKSQAQERGFLKTSKERHEFSRPARLQTATHS